MYQKIFLVFVMLAIGGCNTQREIEQISESTYLQLINEYLVDVREPSGLCFGEDNQSLWTVSDPPVNKIYEINLHGDSPKESANFMCLVPDETLSYEVTAYYKGEKWTTWYGRRHPAADDYIYENGYTSRQDLIEKYPELKGQWEFEQLYNSCNVLNNKGVLIVTHKNEPDKKLVYEPYQKHVQFVF